ncbi:MAG: XcyI family restriction endonuclease [Spirochaetales bacterium]|nr:XcyI family restriction endonuclease [Spirochaetales bacterium]
MKTKEADLQIAFYYRLKEIRHKFLQDALFRTIKKIDVTLIDDELKKFVSKSVLNKIARYGIRGEVFLPVPIVLLKNPMLLGYYRLLFGISQKEFSKTYSKYKYFEEKDAKRIPEVSEINELLELLIPIGEALVNGIDSISAVIAHELQLLTLGPQLRGSRNTELGKAATERTFALIKLLVADAIIEESENCIKIKNALGRNVIIQFSSDPDIIIVENLKTGEHKLVSIEIKGGTDYSNAHNRLGEAEKSHQKAKQDGFFEFWTIMRVDIDSETARKESPTTSHFFNLDNIEDQETDESKIFKDLLSSKLSIEL